MIHCRKNQGEPANRSTHGLQARSLANFLKKPRTKASKKFSSSGAKSISHSNTEKFDASLGTTKEEEGAKGKDTVISDRSSRPTCFCHRPLSEYEVPGPIPVFDTLILDESSISNFFKGIPDIGCESCME